MARPDVWAAPGVVDNDVLRVLVRTELWPTAQIACYFGASPSS